jgi:hypothetical protein
LSELVAGSVLVRSVNIHFLFLWSFSLFFSGCLKFGRIKEVPIAYEVYVMLRFFIPRSSSCLYGNQTDGNRGCLHEYLLTYLLIEKTRCNTV